MEKILWHSNAPWSQTGYGQQTGLMVPRLAEHYDIAVSAFYGLEGAPVRREGILVLPGMFGSFGDEQIRGHAMRHFDGDLRGGLVVTLMDVWVLNPDIWSQMNVACWVPVDHAPAPDAVVQFFRRSNAVPIAMSRFGEDQLRQVGLDPLYCPHGVDTKAFAPRDKAAARERMGLDQDAFIVGVVAANKGNPSRKSFSEIFQAFAQFRSVHDDALLYLHTEATGKANGVPLPPLARSLGIPGAALHIPDQYRVLCDPIPPDAMSVTYSAMDVLLSPSRGEGFGIPVLEAQACGVPVIVCDFSAMSEVGQVGWKLENLTREWSVQQSWQVCPDVGEIVECLEQARRLPEATKDEMARDAREHALGYDADQVTERYMLPALEQARERFEERAPELVAA